MAYDPWFYEALHVGQPGDLAFYAGLCDAHTRVVEFGCGYGRVLASLVQVTPDVVGVELDPALAIRAAQRVSQARIVEGDACSVRVDSSPFDRVFVPFNTLYCLSDTAALLALLRNARRHLHPQGVLAFDVWTADVFHAQGQDDRELPPEHIETVQRAGAAIDIFETSTHDYAEQRVYVTHWADIAGKRRRIGDLVHRYFTREQLEEALVNAGFVAAFDGGFSHQPWTPDADVTVVVAQPDA